MTKHEEYINRCFELARGGFPRACPNPLVGALIVQNDNVVAEGYHRIFGEAHAEVNAIEQVKDASSLRESTLYVNLEPCSHHGKTPPCCDLIISSGIKKIVVANIDPNPMVAGRGIEKLKNAGIEVIVGVCEKEGRVLNIRFFTFHQKHRPYVILKYATTANNFIADENYQSKWISNQYSRLLVHQWRGEEQAILVGTKTAAVDNPRLTNRFTTHKNPLRLVIDKDLKLSPQLHLFDEETPTIVLTSKAQENRPNLQFAEIDFKQDVVAQIMQLLYERNIHSLIVEGGSATLESFIKTGCWDEGRLFVSKRMFEKGVAAPVIKGNLHSVADIMGDQLRIIKNPENE